MPSHASNRNIPLDDHNSNMDKNSNNHIATKLIVLGGFLKCKTSNIGHVRVEKYHKEHEKNLSGRNSRIEINTYFPIRKYIIKKRIIDD